MTSISGLRVLLRTPENEQFEGLCRELESSQQHLVALVAFPPGQAPAIALGERTPLTFLGGGLVASVEVEGAAVLRSDDRSRRCYSFHLGDVPKSMLLLLANRRSSTRRAPKLAVRVDLLDVPSEAYPRAELHDLSATGLSILVSPLVEKQLLNQVRIRFLLTLPGKEPIELAASIRHRRIFKSKLLYGLEFDDSIPNFALLQERFLSYLSVRK